MIYLLFTVFIFSMLENLIFSQDTKFHGNACKVPISLS